jgi:DNA-binding FadR family transcriptional regulator
MATVKTPNPDLFHYLIQVSKTSDDRIPPLATLSDTLKVSVSTLREQLEKAKTLGLVEARPKTGIRRLPYTFTPAVRESSRFAVALDDKYFNQFSDLRIHLEESYFHQAVGRLSREDILYLESLLRTAKEKLRAPRVEIPHGEHRALHTAIFSRLNNTFVTGILEAYWDLYEAYGLNLYSDLGYLQSVWNHHDRIVKAIQVGDFETGLQTLKDHMKLINLMNLPGQSQAFE